MTFADLVIPPPSPKLFNYPLLLGALAGVILTTALLFVASRFDQTGGVLTLSILVVLTFCGVVVFCMFFSVPNDEITSGVVGGLTAAFGAVIAHWLGKAHNSGPPPP